MGARRALVRGPSNVIATAPGTGGGRSLVLNGHVDVVSPEPVGWWTGGDPFSGRIEDGRLHGRGAWDMKGGLAAALWAWEAVRATDVPLRGDVRFESVIEEECTGNGALAARLDAPRADAAIIPECTGLETFTETPVVLWVEVTVRGRPAYVGRPGAYVNAIETAVPLIERLRAQVADGLTLSVGTIRGGDWPSTVPLECSFVCRVSRPARWSVERANGAVEGWIAAAAGRRSLARRQPADHRLSRVPGAGLGDQARRTDVRLLDQVHGAVAGEQPRHVAFPGTADGRAFAARGEPAVYYGPAGANQHAPDDGSTSKASGWSRACSRARSSSGAARGRT